MMSRNGTATAGRRLRVTGGFPRYAHGEWAIVGAAGWPRHPVTGHFFRCSVPDEQERVNRAIWKARRGATIDARTDMLPVTTGEIVSIGGNDMMALWPDIWTGGSVIWSRDVTKPVVNRQFLHAACDNDVTANMRLANWRANKAGGFTNRICDCYGQWAGKTVLIIAGGPTLPENAAHLRRFGEHVIIVAVNRVPDYIDPGLIDAWVVVDHAIKPSYLSKPERYRDFPLVFAEIGANPLIVDHVGRDRVVWYGPEFVPPGLEEMQPDADAVGSFDVSMNVTCAATIIAYQMGAANVVYIGNDLSYRPVSPVLFGDDLELVKVPGASLRYDTAGSAVSAVGEALGLARGSVSVPCERFPGTLQSWHPGFFICKDQRGDAVVCEPILQITKLYHEAQAFFMRRASQEGRRFVRVINATGRGILYGSSGVLVGDFEHLASKLLEAA